MDSLFLEAIVAELRATLTGAAVAKIHQPGPRDLVMRLWTGRENLRLLLSADPAASRLHLTSGAQSNPAAPPRFCQLLRARLKRLLEIRRDPGERVVRQEFAGTGGERLTLVAELFGPRANLVLVDGAGRIVDALHRDDTGGRDIRPGHLYPPPEARGRHDLQREMPEIPGDRSFADWLRDEISPMSPLAAADLAAAVQAGLEPQEALERYRTRLLSGEFTPGVARWQGRPVLFALAPEFVELDRVRLFPTPSAAAEAFFAAAPTRAVFGGRPELEKVVRRAAGRLARRLEKIDAEEARAEGAERQRQLGDLLLANLHRVQRGMSEVTVQDWFAEPPVEVVIPLDPALDPRTNADAFYRKHRKGKRALSHIARRRAETREESEWLEGVRLALEQTEVPADLEAVRAELVAAGLLPRPEGAARRQRPVDRRQQVRSATSPGGYTVYWGRNNTGNDFVSRRLTASGDLWFHARDTPGCHVVLKCADRSGEVPGPDVLFAAAIAAACSRAREAGKVEVMVASGSRVRKPKGARPGLVTVEHYRTVLVAPALPETTAPGG